MKKIAFLVVLVGCVGGGSTAKKEKSVPEKFTAIHSPGFRDIENTQKRFEFLVPRFASLCDDIQGPTKAGDMLVVCWKDLKDAGLGGEETLLEVSNNLFSITNRVAALGLDPLKCSELWAMYLTARGSGMSVQESKDGTVGLIRDLVGS